MQRRITEAHEVLTLSLPFIHESSREVVLSYLMGEPVSIDKLETGIFWSYWLDMQVYRLIRAVKMEQFTTAERLTKTIKAKIKAINTREKQPVDLH